MFVTNWGFLMTTVALLNQNHWKAIHSSFLRSRLLLTHFSSVLGRAREDSRPFECLRLQPLMSYYPLQDSDTTKSICFVNGILRRASEDLNSPCRPK